MRLISSLSCSVLLALIGCATTEEHSRTFVGTVSRATLGIAHVGGAIGSVGLNNSRVNQIAGKVAVQSQLNGLPGKLDAVRSNLGTIGVIIK